MAMISTSSSPAAPRLRTAAPTVAAALRTKTSNSAAWVDGASRFGAFWRITLPLAAPAIAVSAVLCFAFSWNEFIFALVLTSFRAKTAPVALGTFVEGEGMIQWGQLGVLGVGTILPTILFMIFMQRFLVRGLTLGALKG